MRRPIISAIRKIFLVMGLVYILMSLLVFISLTIHIITLNEVETHGYKNIPQFAEICLGNVFTNSPTYTSNKKRIWISPYFTPPITRSPETIEGNSETVTSYLCGAIPFISLRNGKIILYESKYKN
jgi:hypothetical protein